MNKSLYKQILLSVTIALGVAPVLQAAQEIAPEIATSATTTAQKEAVAKELLARVQAFSKKFDAFAQDHEKEIERELKKIQDPTEQDFSRVLMTQMEKLDPALLKESLELQEKMQQLMHDVELQEILGQLAKNNAQQNASTIANGDLQECAARALTTVQKLDTIVEDLLLLIDNNAAPGITDKKAFRKNAIEFRDMITTIKNNIPFASLSADDVVQLNAIVLGMTKHVSTVIDKNLATFPVCDVRTFMKKSGDKEITVDAITRDIMKGATAVEALAKKAEGAGLYWYNKLYRKFIDNPIIKPFSKYKMDYRIPGAALLIGTGVLLYFYSNHLKNKNWSANGGSISIEGASLESLGIVDYLGYLLRKNIGFPIKELPSVPALEGSRITDALPSDTGYQKGMLPPFRLARFDETIKSMYKGGTQSPLLGAALTASTAYALVARQKIKETAINNVTRLHNYLKGGSFYQKAIKGNQDQYIIDPKYTFDDVIGLDDAKDTLRNIVQYLENPEKLELCKMQPQKGYLLTGPSRTGKTFIFEALCGEIKAMRTRTGKDKINFYAINASDLIRVGVKTFFENIKEIAPAVIFIDEIDLLKLQRTEQGTALADFLTGMSGAMEQDPDKVVILVGATNKPENLDFALRQHGRFGKEIRFQYPTLAERIEYLTKKLSRLSNIKNFNIEQLARDTEGKTFEHLAAIVRAAFLKGAATGDGITQKHLEAALDEEVRAMLPAEETGLEENEQKIVAAHQAGRALAVTLLNDLGQKLTKVTVKAYQPTLVEESPWTGIVTAASAGKTAIDDQSQKKIRHGLTMTHREHDIKGVYSKKMKIAHCKLLLAGHIAEELVLGECGYGYNPESGQQALEVAKSIVAEGVELNELTNDLKETYLKKALQLVESYKAEMKKLLQGNTKVLIKLADELSVKKTLTAAQVAAIVQSAQGA